MVPNDTTCRDCLSHIGRVLLDLLVLGCTKLQTGICGDSGVLFVIYYRYSLRACGYSFLESPGGGRTCIELARTKLDRKYSKI